MESRQLDIIMLAISNAANILKCFFMSLWLNNSDKRCVRIANGCVYKLYLKTSGITQPKKNIEHLASSFNFNRNQMKSILNYLIVIFFTASLLVAWQTKSQAQDNTQDVIYLKNGSVLHGKITEIKVNESITLESNCNDIWVLNQSDIERIVKEEIPKSTVLKKLDKTPINYKRKGFYSNINISFMFGGDRESPFPPIGLSFISGYQFDFGLAIGAGLGIDLMDEVYMPIVGDLKYTFRSSKISPFIYFQGGYSISLENPDPYDYEYYDYYESDLESKGGYILNPGIGFKINLNERNAFSFSLGYKYMEMNHTYKEYNGQTIDRKIKSNRIILGFGYYF
jgi:hypothetical protein